MDVAAVDFLLAECNLWAEQAAGLQAASGPVEACRHQQPDRAEADAEDPVSMYVW